jgi:hypothetical protein
MFLYYFIHVRRPFKDVERVLTEEPHSWLPSAMADAYARGEDFHSRLGVGKEMRIGKEVVVHIADAIRNGTKASVPFRVEAAGATALFPRLEADLEAVAIGQDMTQLTVKGSYRPPLGSLGEILDRALLHYIAEAVVKRFLDGVGEVLERGDALSA